MASRRFLRLAIKLFSPESIIPILHGPCAGNRFAAALAAAAHAVARHALAEQNHGKYQKLNIVSEQRGVFVGRWPMATLTVSVIV